MEAFGGDVLAGDRGWEKGGSELLRKRKKLYLFRRGVSTLHLFKGTSYRGGGTLPRRGKTALFLRGISGCV